VEDMEQALPAHSHHLLKQQNAHKIHCESQQTATQSFVITFQMWTNFNNSFQKQLYKYNFKASYSMHSEMSCKRSCYITYHVASNLLLQYLAKFDCSTVQL